MGCGQERFGDHIAWLEDGCTIALDVPRLTDEQVAAAPSITLPEAALAAIRDIQNLKPDLKRNNQDMQQIARAIVGDERIDNGELDFLAAIHEAVRTDPLRLIDGQSGEVFVFRNIWLDPLEYPPGPSAAIRDFVRGNAARAERYDETAAA